MWKVQQWSNKIERVTYSALEDTYAISIAVCPWNRSYEWGGQTHRDTTQEHSLFRSCKQYGCWHPIHGQASEEVVLVGRQWPDPEGPVYQKGVGTPAWRWHPTWLDYVSERLLWELVVWKMELGGRVSKNGKEKPIEKLYSKTRNK